MKKLIFAFTCLCLAVPCQARIITVNWDGSGDYLTIQAAINDANDGDTIIVADGIYTGEGNRDIDFGGRAITVRSENIPQNCVIDCQGTEDDPHRGFKFVSGEGPDSVLTGLTIANGHGPLDYIKEQLTSSIGGAILCSTSSPTISNCNIRDNSASNGGAICCCKGSAPKIKNCVIVNNSGFGGGIYCLSSSPEIINCVISDNMAPMDCSFGYPICLARSAGGIACESSIPIISNCLISGNSATATGGGIYSYKGNPIINNCTISCNSAANKGGGIRCNSGCAMTVTNCILWSNTASDGQQISLKKMSDLCPTITISYSDIEGGQDKFDIEGCGHVNWGPGNTDTDPCFVDLFNGHYHLKSQVGRWEPNSENWMQDDVTSPCIDAGNPGCPVGDEPLPNGNRRNMGAYGGTAEASKSPADWRSIADLTNDWLVDSNDLKVFVDYWLRTGECIPSDLDRSQFVDLSDFAIFGLQWSYPSAFEPGMTYHIGDCNMEGGLNLPMYEEPNQPRFSVWVEGRYIHFEDMMYANCCPDELGLEKEVNGNQITLYEIGYGGLCDCMCYFPITATLGPFEDGTYTVEVYDNYGKSLGIVEVTIGQSTEPTIVYQIEDCNQNAFGLFSAEPPDQTRFTVTVEGLYIHFKDMMVANCCPDKLGLEMTVKDDLITIYETEYTPGGCFCICDYPVTATLGPFEPGTYTLEVYEEWSGFIGSTTVVIDPPG